MPLSLYPVGVQLFPNNEGLSAAWALRCAGLCVLALGATWVLAALVPIAHTQDAVALNDFTELSRPRVDAPANLLLKLLDPALYTLWALSLVAVALARGRERMAAAVAVVMAGAPLSSELLKPLLAHPHAQLMARTITDASWPSGHSTAAMALVLCAVLVAPGPLRALVAAVGAIFAVAVGFALLVLAWHMPSDVFGGYLVAALWGSLAVAVLCWLEQRFPAAGSRPVRRPRPAAHNPLGAVAFVLALTGLAAFVLLVALRTHHHIGSFALDHRALLVAAGAITVLAGTIASTLAAALRN